MFISTGDAAFMEMDGATYELPPEQVAGLRGSPDASRRGPFDELDVDSWVIDPAVEEGARLDGVPTERLRAEVDVVAALNDLIGMAGSLGAQTEPIEGEDAERLRRVVRAAQLELSTGREDGLLRRLTLDVDLGARPAPALREALDGLLGVSFSLRLDISGPNEPVQVSAPLSGS
ncbi:MAG: hypothetical protein ABR529_15635 [Actinomycetota bacterium]